MPDAMETPQVDTGSAPPGDPRELCGWARRALDAGEAAPALAQWRGAGEPARQDPAVSVAIALLEAELEQWTSVRDRVVPVLETARENSLAGGLRALAAFHLGERLTAADLFARHGLFAAFPLVRLFIRAFAMEVRRHPDRYPWPGAETDPAAADVLAVPIDEKLVRPSLWKRFFHGGGLGPDSDARALVLQGDRALMAGNLAKALGCFQAAARHDPENWMARMAAALCLLEQGRFEQAADELIDLLGVHPDVPNLASAAAWGLLHLEDYETALEILATLTPAGPDDWGLHYIASLAFLGLGKREKSDQMLREALGPYFLDTWEQFVMPLFHRVTTGLRAEERGGTEKSDETEGRS